MSTLIPPPPISPIQHFYGVCERTDLSLLAEPPNVVTNFSFILVAILLFRHYRNHQDLKGQWMWDVHVLTFLIFLIGVCSTIFHLYPHKMTELFDVIPIVTFINLFFLSIIVRIGQTNLFQTIICYLASLGTGYFLVNQFPNAMNDSIGYLSSMVALVMIAIYLHMRKRASAHQFLLAAFIGVFSLFFRVIDNDVCQHIPIGTHFIWHSLNATLLYILMKQVIRNVNRGARMARVRAMNGLTP